jgi:glutaredoxin-related protein
MGERHIGFPFTSTLAHFRSEESPVEMATERRRKSRICSFTLRIIRLLTVARYHQFASFDILTGSRFIVDLHEIFKIFRSRDHAAS